MAKLTDNELDKIVASAAEAREENEKNRKEFIESATTVASTGDEPITINMEGKAPEDATSGYIEEVIPTEEENVEVDVSEEDLSKNAQNSLGLSEEEAIQFLQCINEYKKNKKYPAYKNVPETIRSTVRSIAAKEGLSFQHYNEITRMILDEFLIDTEMNSALESFDKELKDAMAIPSILDMYSEHTKTIMDVNIPNMIEKIKDEYPDKAKQLEEVRDVFYKTIKLDDLKTAYESNSRIRKTVRRGEKELKSVIDTYNFKSMRSKFKVPDANDFVSALEHVLCEEPRLVAQIQMEARDEIPEFYATILDLKVTRDDIVKFCILACKSCDDMNPDDIIDASYMYYLSKNIVSLAYTQETKTDFTVELINNICDVIAFIRNKEAEFNAEHLDKSKHGEKLHPVKGGKG